MLRCKFEARKINIWHPLYPPLFSISPPLWFILQHSHISMSVLRGVRWGPDLFLLKNFPTLFRSSTILVNHSCTIRINKKYNNLSVRRRKNFWTPPKKMSGNAPAHQRHKKGGKSGAFYRFILPGFMDLRCVPVPCQGVMKFFCMDGRVLGFFLLKTPSKLKIFAKKGGVLTPKTPPWIRPCSKFIRFVRFT